MRQIARTTPATTASQRLHQQLLPTSSSFTYRNTSMNPQNPPANLQQQRFKSGGNGGGFIKEIMNQVQQELNKDKKFQEAKEQEEKLRETAAKAADKGILF